MFDSGQTTPRHAEQLEMKTVLMVEDDPKITLAFSIRLRALGYTVHTAADAVVAVSQVRKHKPDVVVLDISLPGGDGFLVAERISKLDGPSPTPIVFITASQRPDLRDRALGLGAVGFLQKPFDAAELSDAIESALSYAEGRRQQQEAHEVRA
jgi:CheY-like chemotaxis protein